MPLDLGGRGVGELLTGSGPEPLRCGEQLPDLFDQCVRGGEHGTGVPHDAVTGLGRLCHGTGSPSGGWFSGSGSMPEHTDSSRS